MDLRADSKIRSQVGMDRRLNPEVIVESALKRALVRGAAKVEFI